MHLMNQSANCTHWSSLGKLIQEEENSISLNDPYEAMPMIFLLINFSVVNICYHIKVCHFEYIYLYKLHSLFCNPSSKFYIKKN